MPGLPNSKKQVQLDYEMFTCVMLEFPCSCPRLYFRGLKLKLLLRSCLKCFVLMFLSRQRELEEPEMLSLSKYRGKSNSMFCDAHSIAVCLCCLKDGQERGKPTSTLSRDPSLSPRYNPHEEQGLADGAKNRGKA